MIPEPVYQKMGSPLLSPVKQILRGPSNDVLPEKAARRVHHQATGRSQTHDAPLSHLIKEELEQVWSDLQNQRAN